MKKNLKIVLIYGIIVIVLMITLYILLLHFTPTFRFVTFKLPFIVDVIITLPEFQEIREFILILSLLFPIITTLISFKMYYSMDYALPFLFSGFAFLFFQGAWMGFPNIFYFSSSVYFFAGMMLVGLSLWLESKLMVKRNPEVFKKTEEKPEPMDIQFTEEDYQDEVQFWIKLLDSSDKKFREEAIISLGEIGDERALVHLEKLLKDDSRSIRNLTNKAINAIKNKKNQELVK